MIVLEGATGFPSGIIFSNQDLPVAIFIPSKTRRAINFQATAAEVPIKQRKQAMLAAIYGRPLSCQVLLPVNSDSISRTIRAFWQSLRPYGRLDNDINLL
jgi:hypothetical protein